MPPSDNARTAITLLVVGATLALTTVELSRSRIAHAAEGEIFRAYDTPVPNSVEFHNMMLTVLDDETGKPIAEAEAKILNYIDLKFHSGFTDSYGQIRFDFPHENGQGDVSIEVRRNGYVPVRYPTGEEETPLLKQKELTIRLRRGTTMGGIVVHVGDQPVKDAMVVLTVNKYGEGKRSPNPTGYEMYYEVPSRTGPDGRWRTDSIPPGTEEVGMMIIHPDFVSDAVWRSNRVANIVKLRDQIDRQVMFKGTRVSGRVVNAEGEPIANASVVDSTTGMVFLEYTRQTRTDASGEYHINIGREDKQITLTVEAKGHQPVTRAIEPVHGMPAVNFDLKLSKSLRLRVVDPKDQPIAGAGVIIPSQGPHKGIFFRRFTDREGRLEWTDAPEEAVAFMISAEGFNNPLPVSLKASDVEQKVVLKPSLDVHLRAADAETGKLIKKFSIRVTRVDSNGPLVWNGPGSSTDYAHLTTHLLPEQGPFQIEISSEDYEPFMTRVIRGDEKVFRDTVKLKKAKNPAKPR